MANADALDPSACPLCGQPNQCAMQIAQATGQPPGECWCVGVDFSAELLARIPAAAQRLACVCQRCASPPTAKGRHG